MTPTLALAATLVLPSPSLAQDSTPAPYTLPAELQLSGEIVSDGSSTVGPVTRAVAKGFAALAPDVQISVDISGTGGGFQRFCTGETDAQNASRPIEADEDAACVMPSIETIADGSYAPLSRPLFIYVNAASLDRPEVQELMRFYVASAQELVDDVGDVQSPADVYAEDASKLEADIAGTGTPDGPAASREMATPSS